MLLILSYSLKLQAQKECNVTIKFSPSFDIEKAKIYFDGGTGLYEPRTIKKVYKIHISAKFRSADAAIEIRYPRKDGLKPDHRMGFFLTDKPAEISFYKNDSSANKLGRYEVNNAIPFTDLGGQGYHKFVSSETKKYWENYNKSNDIEKEDAQLDSKLKVAREALINRSIEYILTHRDEYYSFWFFRNKVGPTTAVDADSLYNIYTSVFADDLRNSDEGQLLKSRLEATLIRKGLPAPTFTTDDINGDKVSLNQLHDRYVLLNFWGTWCGPCIAEFPALKKIRKKYPEKEVEFIFVNTDKDPEKFATALEKYKLSFGIHLPRNERIMDDYYVSFIPRLFLISPDGTILYSRHEEKDGEQLKHLNSLLEQLLGEGT